MTSKFHVRPAQLTDFPLLLEIWRRAVAATHDFVTPEDRAAIDRAVAEDYLPSAELLVATNVENGPIAFLGGSGREIESLFVDPSVHGQGAGRLLLEHFDRLGEGDLIVEVNEQNGGARAFYERLGFRVVSRSPLDGQGRPYPLLRLVR